MNRNTSLEGTVQNGRTNSGSEPDDAQQDQAQAAFNRAIRTGRLTKMTARNYMFMGFDTQGRATFKHRDTRKYLPH